MSNPTLVAVANATPYIATLTSTNNNGLDSYTIQPYINFHTGGTGNDSIKIPQCSGSQWYSNHHILITGRDQSGNVHWTVSLFSNDEENAVLYWNKADAYDNSTQLVGSAGDEVVSAIFIGQGANGEVFVNWQGR